MNKNNKEPYFFPTTQRAQITENTVVGTMVLKLNGTDPDVSDPDDLIFDFIEPITAVDKDGARVSDSDGRFKQFFSINQTTGEVFVSDELDRTVAASVTMTVSLTDQSASPIQVIFQKNGEIEITRDFFPFFNHPNFLKVGLGSLVITIVDVNDFPPAFDDPAWTPQSPMVLIPYLLLFSHAIYCAFIAINIAFLFLQLNINILEEQPKDTIVHTFRATDVDSNIDHFKIINPASRSKRLENF